jgi:tetratricopeptide (TPR) repeat protein
VTQRDGRGLPVSTENAESVQGYERALAMLQCYTGDPLAAIDETLAQDPDFLSGHSLRAALLVTSTERRALPELRQTLARAEALIARGVGNERERAHVGAVRAWHDGDFALASDRYNRIALEHPRDMLALQISHVSNFFLGRSNWLRDQIAAALPHHALTEPSYGYLQGMLAFGLEESGEYESAERAGMRALELNRRDAWAVHAVAHVYEMQGRLAEGSNWLTRREPDWAPGNFFAVHNYWHLALFHLELGDHARVIEIYDAAVRGSGSEVIMDLLDASALLWRLDLAGADVRERWLTLAQVWRRIEEEGYYAFNDWHALMAYARSDARHDVARVLEGLERSAAGPGSNADFARDAGLPVGRAFAAFAAGDSAQAVELLFKVRPLAARFGGSHAQRDLLELTLIEAAVRDQQYALARGLVQQRHARKPTSPSPLRMLARVYARAGAPDSASSASQDAERIAAAQLAALDRGRTAEAAAE